MSSRTAGAAAGPRGQVGSRGGGRININDREFNDVAPAVGHGDQDLEEEVQAGDARVDNAIHDIIAQGMNQATRRDYRSRIARIIAFWKKAYPKYCDRGGIRRVTEDELSDRGRFFTEKTKEDIVYEGIRVKPFVAFLSANNKRAKDGKFKSFEDLRKYRDAIQWGAKMAKQLLPSDFYRETEQYLRSYKRMLATERRKGNVEENATDPIPVPVYRLLLRRSIETNNMFAWLWTLLQWNCMARSSSIDALGLHNFSLGIDSIVIKYDDSKADKAGEKLSEKNLYANPLDWTMCSWTALGKFFYVFFCFFFKL